MRIGSALVMLIIAFVGLGYLLSDNLNTRQALQELESTQSQEYSEEIDRLNNEIFVMKQDLDKLSREIGESGISPDVLVLRGEIQKMNERLTDIENALLLDPEKAMTILILRTELENTQKDLDRLYNIVDVIGIAIFSSMITLALGTINFGRKSS